MSRRLVRLRYLSLAIGLGFIACSSSSSTGTNGGKTGALGGKTGTLGGTTGALGGTIGAAGGSTGAVGGSTGAVGGSTGAVGGTTGAPGGTTGAAGAAGKTGAGGSGGGGGGTGAGGNSAVCGDIPPCIANLIANCTGSGTCVEQQMIGTSSLSHNRCYSNGVKSISLTTADETTGMGATMVTFSKGGATCFTEEATFSNGAGGTSGAPMTSPVTVKNAAGVTVATFVENPPGSNILVVTCGGQSYNVSDSGSCDMTSNGAGGTSGSMCTTGVCTP